ncbi:MAG: protein kinase [Polyangiaceae bacterium]
MSMTLPAPDAATVVADGAALGQPNLPPSSLVGHLLGGRFDVLDRIGVGGMGEVFRAHDRELDEMVALKVLRPEIASDPRVIERFRNEVKLARRVTHANVARTFELGEAGGQRFLTMELVEGEPLSSVLARRGALGEAAAVRTAIGIAEALEAAHAARVLHRDIKPDNVLCERGGRVVVTDFGIALPTQTSGHADLSGTPHYMSPEQVRGEPLTPASDVYSLGITLYEMVTAELPFAASSTATVMTRRLHEPAPDPRARRPELSAALASLVTKALAPATVDRFQTAAELRRALELVRERDANSESAGEGAPASDGQGLALEPRSSEAPRIAAGFAGELLTIALLPCRLSAATAYLGEALFDRLAISLSRLPRLRVVTRAFVDATTTGARLAIARELQAAFVVDGVEASDPRTHVDEAGARVCLALSVCETQQGTPLWSARVMLDAERISRVVEVSTSSVALALDLEPETTPHAALEDAVTIDLVLRARHFYNSWLPHDHDRALGLFERALARSPEDPQVLAGFAMAITRRAFYGTSVAGSRARASVAASRALELAPDLPESQLANGHLALHSGQPEMAGKCFRAAIGVAPQLAEPHEWVGRMLLEIGMLKDGEKRFNLAMRIDPRQAFIRWEMARAYALEGDWNTFERIAREARGGEPRRIGRWAGHIRFATWLSTRDELERVAEEFRDAPESEIFDAPFCRALLLAHHDRDWSGARPLLFERALDDSFESTRRRSFYCQLVTEAACVFGELDEALDLLERSDRLALIDLHWLDRCVLLDALRGSPRFTAVSDSVRARADRVAEMLYRG